MGPSSLQVGDVVAGKYRLERLLGSGGMAEVYAAVNIRTEKRVALKWVLPSLASTVEGRTRFRREAQAAGRINHPNVVTIFDIVEHQGSLALVMELLEGETLAKRLARTSKLPFVETVALILPAMRGVAAAHAQGVVHRDLKPDNIFICLDAEGQVRDCKVLDFGVSKLAVPDAEGNGDITVTGNLVGTPAYMAPEQVRGLPDVDHRADVYALGVVLYQMMAGRPPFVRDSYSAVMVDIATSDAPPLSSFRPDVPRRIAQVVHRALERSLEKRFADTPSLIRALEEAARTDLHLAVGTPPEGLITQIGVTRPGIDQTTRGLRALAPTRATRATVIVAASVIILEAGFGIWRLSSDEPAPAPPARAAATAAAAAPAAEPAAAAAPPPGAAAAHAAAAAPSAAAAAAIDSTEADEAAARAVRKTRAAAQRGASPNDGHPGRAASTPASGPARHPRAGKLTVDDF